MATAALLLSSSATLAVSLPPGETAFSSYMTEFGKSYSNEEEPVRRRLFEASAQEWATLAAEHPHARFGPTKFSDWTDEEFAQLHPIALQATANKADVAQDFLNITEEDIAAAPASLDWREQGAVTEIRDQQTCGGCWAFSTIANIEGAAVVQGGKDLVPLSEQMLLDCSHFCGSYAGYIGCNMGCNGGLQGAALDDLTLSSGDLKNKKVDAESVYPFAGKSGKCQYSSPGVVGVTTWKYVNEDETKMQAALAKYGPLAVSVNDGGKGGPWMSYKGGVLSGSGSSGDLNHGVTLVGYGIDSGKDYWLVKNSWGSAWGEEGYIRLERGTCQCGICNSVLTAIIDSADDAVITV